MERKIRVAILDDHQSIVDGYQFRLSQKPDIEVVGTANFGQDLPKLTQDQDLDVLILDISVPIGPDDLNPYPILLEIPTLLKQYPDLRILVISMYTQAGMIKAIMDAGAHGYILKDDRASISKLGEIVQVVARGGVHLSKKAYDQLSKKLNVTTTLTPRQLQALSLCAAHPGATTASLAENLEVAHSTFRNLLSGIYRKLGVESRYAAIAKARQLGLITPNGLDGGGD